MTKWRKSQAFNAFSDKLSVVMVQLRDASASVKNAAQEIAAGNQDLPGVPSRRHPACAKPPAP
jgi:methyl-accepting chemotaxis protein